MVPELRNPSGSGGRLTLGRTVDWCLPGGWHGLAYSPGRGCEVQMLVLLHHGSAGADMCDPTAPILLNAPGSALDALPSLKIGFLSQPVYNHRMAEFVSEAIRPVGGAFETSCLSQGEPGLPPAFEWRGTSAAIVAVLDRWRHCTREGAWAQGQLYLRRHYFRVRMDDGSAWTVYCLRQGPRNRKHGSRWFLETIDRSTNTVPTEATCDSSASC